MIIDRVRQAGVVGAGGAGFPTHVKIDADVDTVIVNGAECEPLLRVDQELMEKKTADLINGLEFVKETTGATKVIIALKKKYEKAISNIENEIANKRYFSTFLLEDFYPAGDEQQLVYEVTGKIVPEAGIPLMCGVVVINVETVINIDNAIKGDAVTDKYLTITGAVKQAMTINVAIGTKISDIIQLAGGTTVDKYGLLDGGPMMGKVVDDEDIVTKTTKGIIVLPAEHSILKSKTLSVKPMVKRAMSACCQCRACTDVCPRYLLGKSIEPHKIMRAIAMGIDTDIDSVTSAMLCCECGVCDISCPMQLSPKHINMEIKNELAQKGFRKDKKELEKSHSMRDYRKLPVKRLIKKLGIYKWNLSAPINDINFKPDLIELPLVQHIGAPAEPLVNIGERVEVGQLIAKIPENSLGATLHSGVSGIVKSISDRIVIKKT